MERRAYADGDLPRLQDAVAAWIAEAGPCGYGHVGDLPHRIYEDLHACGRPEELVDVWERGGDVVAVAITLRFGCAVDVLAAPSLRGTDAGLEVLRVASGKTAAGLAGDEHFILSDVFDCDAARIDALSRLGFERFRTWDDVRERPLEGPIAAVEAPPGFVVRSARRADAEQLALARNSAFGAHWTGDSYRACVMEKPGWDPKREIVVESPEGRIAAFTTYWLDQLNRVGQLEPVGTHGDFRRRGLARAAMVEALQRLAAAGMRTVTIMHDTTNVPAQRLYASLGLRKRGETYGFRKPRA